MKIKTKLFGDHPSLAIIYDNIGSVLFNLSDISGAKENFSKAVELQKKFGDRSGFTAHSLHKLGLVSETAKNPREALKYFSESYEIRKSINDKHLDEALKKLISLAKETNDSSSLTKFSEELKAQNNK